MKTNSVVSEILQGLIALVIIVLTCLILLYQIVNKLPVTIPDVLAGFDGVVITFYFARVGQQQIAQAAANGTAQGFASSGTNATTVKPTP